MVVGFVVVGLLVALFVGVEVVEGLAVIKIRFQVILIALWKILYEYICFLVWKRNFNLPLVHAQDPLRDDEVLWRLLIHHLSPSHR